MKNNDLNRSLKQLKNLKSAGLPSGDFVAQNREILMMQIKNSAGEVKRPFAPAYIWKAFESIVPETTFRFVVRPVLMGLLVLGIAFGGWSATVKASQDSLPGDALYSIKIMAENAQLSLTSSENKVSLQTELAEKRLAEMRAILEAPYTEDQEERTKTAVQNFSKQVKAVQTTLENLDSNKSGAVLEAAKIVDTKTAEYTIALEGAKDGLTGSAMEAMEEATDAVDNASIKAVSVIIKEGGESGDNASKAEETIKIVEEKAQNVATSTGSGTLTEEVKDVLDKAKTALDNNDLNTVMDKVVEAKNLVNSATGASASSTNISE
ncbi:hypothetical protein KJ885_00985 [Patescibacteria group bacterium]|nr:hypothetical protein [Patescibacteria group bacterium]